MRKGRPKAIALQGYRLWNFYGSPEKFVLRSTAKAALGDRSVRRLLEIGGGTSMMRNVLIRQSRCELFVSSDLAATERTDLVCDATQLPFESASFDAVVAFEVLEHVSAVEHAVRESARVCRPDGTLVISLPFMYGIHDFADFRRLTPLGVQRILAAEGFRLEKCVRRGGTFSSVVGLIGLLLTQKVMDRPEGWRSGGRKERWRMVAGTLVAAPMLPFRWLAFALDAIVDRRSKNAPGFVFVARLMVGG